MALIKHHMRLTSSKIQAFQKEVWDHYRREARTLPWRKTKDPYHIVVSELMLQQTQVSRVLSKYDQFLKTFPNWNALASAQLPSVLSVWQGLGYNRRAKYLHQIANHVVREHQGRLPSDFKLLTDLPGIGPNTAGAILAYAFNIPHPFLETNIKAIYIHHFFPRKKSVSDTELLALVEATLDQKNPRRWFNALMDYGTMIKAVHGNAARRSATYTIQSVFKGSRREVRGAILRAVLQNKKLPLHDLAKVVTLDLRRKVSLKEIELIYKQLILEKLVS